jgi:hypothetical protein
MLRAKFIGINALGRKTKSPEKSQGWMIACAVNPA